MKLLVILFLLEFICDLFMFLPKNGIANYADDNTPYSTGTGIHNIISDLEQVSDILSKWFQDNYLKANPGKYHVLLSETYETQLTVKNVPITSSCCEKLLGIKLDHKLSFEPHVESLCKSQSKTQCTGTDGLFFKVQAKKIIIKRIYYIPILLCTSSLDVSF